MGKDISYMAVVKEMDRTPVGSRPPEQAPPPPEKTKTIPTRHYDPPPWPTSMGPIRRKVAKSVQQEGLSHWWNQY